MTEAAGADERDVLSANQAFYDAFAARSYDGLDALWAREHDACVIHPGWPPIFGRDAVLDSWRRIVDGPSPPDIRCSAARARVLGDVAFVVCTEHLADGDVVATNGFVREGAAWRIFHHHAGPLPPIVAPADGRTVH